MRILHTEASPGWGGQELRILYELESMRKRGHHLLLAVQKGGGLVVPAKAAGFKVIEVCYSKARVLPIIWQLWRLVREEGIEIINTHSSLDAWLGGIVGKLCGKKVIRTRHLSTPIRKGLNSHLLYNWLADSVATTCEEAAERIRRQAHLSVTRCRSVPTGIDPEQIHYNQEEVAAFRAQMGVRANEYLAGTLCILRGWKGISDLLQAAKLLEHIDSLKWVIVGSGGSEEHFRQEWRRLGLADRVIFTGPLFPPYTALMAMDIFLLLSQAHEGVSQATLQAAWLEKPLITTSVGGLKEVCLDGVTGFLVPQCDPTQVAHAVTKLIADSSLRKEMGKKGKELVRDKFLLSYTLDQMEKMYTQ